MDRLVYDDDVFERVTMKKRRGWLEMIFDVLMIVNKYDGIAKTTLWHRANLHPYHPVFDFVLENKLVELTSHGRITRCHITDKGYSVLLCFRKLLKKLYPIPITMPLINISPIPIAVRIRGEPGAKSVTDKGQGPRFPVRVARGVRCEKTNLDDT